MSHMFMIAMQKEPIKMADPEYPIHNNLQKQRVTSLLIL